MDSGIIQTEKIAKKINIFFKSIYLLFLVLLVMVMWTEYKFSFVSLIMALFTVVTLLAALASPAGYQTAVFADKPSVFKTFLTIFVYYSALSFNSLMALTPLDPELTSVRFPMMLSFLFTIGIILPYCLTEITVSMLHRFFILIYSFVISVLIMAFIVENRSLSYLFVLIGFLLTSALAVWVEARRRKASMQPHNTETDTALASQEQEQKTEAQPKKYETVYFRYLDPQNKTMTMRTVEIDMSEIEVTINDNGMIHGYCELTNSFCEFKLADIIGSVIEVSTGRQVAAGSGIEPEAVS